LGCALTAPDGATAQTTETLTLRGHAQSVRVYGSRGGTPVIVSTGAWVRAKAPH
jgi:hypothetical protein